MKKLLISRYGAFGDVLHCSHLPRLFSEAGYTVDFETNEKGYKVLYNNPYINNLIGLSTDQIKGKTMSWMERHWEMMADGYDRFLNLFGTIENKLVAMEEQNTYFRDKQWRRDNYSHINYFDAMTIEAGFDNRLGTAGEVYFDYETEDKIIEEYLSKYEDRYVVLINIAGSSPQKRFTRAKEVARQIYHNIPRALVITTGDKESRELDFLVNDSRSIVGKWGFRQAMCLAKHVDLVISYESGLPIASQIFGTPTIQLMTTSSIANHVRHVENAYPIQSPVSCSPCNRGPYKFLGCPKNADGYPACIDIPVETIIEKVKVAYDHSNAVTA